MKFDFFYIGEVLIGSAVGSLIGSLVGVLLLKAWQ